VQSEGWEGKKRCTRAGNNGWGNSEGQKKKKSSALRMGLLAKVEGKNLRADDELNITSWSDNNLGKQGNRGIGHSLTWFKNRRELVFRGHRLWSKRAHKTTCMKKEDRHQKTKKEILLVVNHSRGPTKAWQNVLRSRAD